jgi:xanthine dehydrogenase accessory factor
MLVDDTEILLQAENWRRSRRGVAIATVVETFGSAPRPVGSHLVVEESGLFYGSVSAGCIEGEVVTAALEIIADGGPRLLEFGIADETAWRPGLSCGGRIAVYVEKIHVKRFDALAGFNRERVARRPCALVTSLEDGETQLLRSSGLALVDAPGDAVQGLLRAGKSGVVTREGRRYFVETFRPPPRLIAIGAVHVAQALVPMARVAGFDVIVVDPREAFSVRERFPDARLDQRWPDEALPDIGLDALTAVAALTHDPKIDDAALRQALVSECFYVGALGSRTSHARRVKRLVESGVSPDALERLCAPIGLDIGAVSPAEIAISVLGEIILARRQKPLRRECA